MAALFETGAAALIILAVLGAEAVWLVARRRRVGAVLLALGPAACFAFALGAALSAQAWPLVALPLALAWPLHLADLRRRGWL